MGLFWQTLVFLVVTAALGFALGWVVRGSRLQSERPGAAPRQASAAAALEDERDRLRTELQAARAAHAELEASLAEAQNLAEARAGRVRELEAAEADARQRIAELEAELERARRAPDSPQTQVGQGDTAQPGAPSTTEVAGGRPETIAGAPPQGLAAPEGEPDDLKRINGIGPGIEKVLHGLGIYHFHQIARFTPDNVAWINQRLRFKGRVEREDWIGQARRLAAGEAVDRAPPGGADRPDGG